MNYLEYAQSLLELQSPTGVQKPTNFRYYAAISFGFVEELHEYIQAQENQGDVLAEAGDVLAYGMLLVMSREASYQSFPDFTRTTVNPAEVFSISETYDFEPNHLKYPGYFSRKFKRYFRENANVSVLEIAAATLLVIVSSGYTFDQVAQANINKLQSRFDRGVLMKGSGDNR